MDRPQLAAMLAVVREGDAVIVRSMDRLLQPLNRLYGDSHHACVGILGHKVRWLSPVGVESLFRGHEVSSMVEAGW